MDIKCSQDILSDVIKNVYNTSTLKFGLCENILSEDTISQICNNSFDDDNLLVQQTSNANKIKYNSSNEQHVQIHELKTFESELASLIGITNDMLTIFSKLKEECKHRIKDLLLFEDDGSKVDVLDKSPPIHTPPEIQHVTDSKKDTKWSDVACGSNAKQNKESTNKSFVSWADESDLTSCDCPGHSDRVCGSSSTMHNANNDKSSKSHSVLHEYPSNVNELSKIDKDVPFITITHNSKNKKRYCPTTPTNQKYKQIELAHVNINLPVVNTLEDIKPAFVWYEPENKVYTCLTNGFYIEVPFPDTTDISTGGDRTKTVPCKHGDVNRCLKSREYAATKYNSSVRSCNFAHCGDVLTKVGIPARCPTMPRLGQHITLKHDIKKITEEDIRTVLMYGLSDSLLGLMWHQHSQSSNPDPLILKSLERCQ